MRDETFVTFVRGAQGALLRFGCLLAAGDTHVAADLTQDALIEVGRRWSRVRSMASPLAYTKTVMARRYARKRRYDARETLPGTLAEGAASSPEPFDHSPVWAALATLPARQRAVLVLRYYEDLDEAGIAAALGCTRGTVKSQASRGLATLRARTDLAGLLGEETARDADRG